jgi:hypothetical protein
VIAIDAGTMTADYAALRTIVVNPLVAAVPEPGTWGMMIFGFGVVGSALRRRRGATRAPMALA